jgi:hypothetical protein
MSMPRVLVFLSFLSFLSFACQPGMEDSPEVFDATVDWTTDVPDAIAVQTGVYEIPPYTEQMLCAFATYSGDDVGIVRAEFYQNQSFGHHVLLMQSEADEDDWPDGTVADCTDSNPDIMVDSRPFLFAQDVEEGSAPLMTLPEGLAVELEAGTRFVIQSHYMNTTPQAIQVNDAVFLEPTDPDLVETWAAPWVHAQTDFLIPAGDALSLEVECTFDRDVYLLSLFGHMHQWGTSYSVDHLKVDESVERIYDIPEWYERYRYPPPIQAFELYSFPLKTGEHFVTTCAWHNDTDEDLVFPFEMCATVGFAYPLTATLICQP